MRWRQVCILFPSHHLANVTNEAKAEHHRLLNSLAKLFQAHSSIFIDYCTASGRFISNIKHFFQYIAAQTLLTADFMGQSSSLSQTVVSHSWSSLLKALCGEKQKWKLG